MNIQYLDLEHVIAIHDTLIEELGGSLGIRDQGLLESAISQAQQSFGGYELYPTLFDKSASYAFFISENQPFIDGNKRTAVSSAGVFLDINGYVLDCPSGELYAMMMKLANKKLKKEDLSKWFEKHSIKKQK